MDRIPGQSENAEKRGSTVEAEKQSYSWREENGRFIPGIVKWLEKETWRSFVQQAETVEEDEEWTSF